MFFPFGHPACPSPKLSPLPPESVPFHYAQFRLNFFLVSPKFSLSGSLSAA
jgi:hypothetical protein